MDTLERIRLTADSIELAYEMQDKIQDILASISHEDVSYLAAYKVFDGIDQVMVTLRSLEHSEVMKLLSKKPRLDYGQDPIDF